MFLILFAFIAQNVKDDITVLLKLLWAFALKHTPRHVQWDDCFWTVVSFMNYIYSSLTALKMLSMYLYTLLISHKSCKMLRMLNKLTLQKDLQNVVTNNAFIDKKYKHNNNKTKKYNIKTVAGTGNWTRYLLQPMRMRYHCTTESTESNDC